EADPMYVRTRSARRHKRYLFGKRELRSGENTDRRRGAFGIGKSSCPGPEITRGQLVADFCSTRLDLVQAVVAHAEELLFRPPNQPHNSPKQRWCQCDQLP